MHFNYKYASAVLLDDLSSAFNKIYEPFFFTIDGLTNTNRSLSRLFD